MTDLVERLRSRADDKFIRDYPLIGEAADEIVRLQGALATSRELRELDKQEIVRLRASLAEWKALAISWAKDNEPAKPSDS